MNDDDDTRTYDLCRYVPIEPDDQENHPDLLAEAVQTAANYSYEE